MRMSTRVKKASSRSISRLSPAPATKTLCTAFAEVFHSFRTEFSPEPAHKVHAQGGNYITKVLYTTSTDVIASQGEKVALFSVSRFNDPRSFVATVRPDLRSEEHASELQSLMRISYAVFCLKNKTNTGNGDHLTDHSRW